mmetsp:Transcript_41466/g.109360  ORF Transcript_41466/g.109360 Transcript_41466/m.109360 type:complete len:201 (+) Transcript_41466:1013-1615(+)
MGLRSCFMPKPKKKKAMKWKASCQNVSEQSKDRTANALRSTALSCPCPLTEAEVALAHIVSCGGACSSPVYASQSGNNVARKMITAKMYIAYSKPRPWQSHADPSVNASDHTPTLPPIQAAPVADSPVRAHHWMATIFSTNCAATKPTPPSAAPKYCTQNPPPPAVTAMDSGKATPSVARTPSICTAIFFRRRRYAKSGK